MKKKILCTLLAAAMVCGLTGCNGSSGSGNGENSDGMSGKIVFAIWDNNLMEYIEANDMEAKFKEQYPNAEIEVEKIKDDSEYWNSMKMRASANQLPDVMFNKPFTLSRFQDYLIDLSDTEACKNNTLAEGYALNGKVLGIPQTAGYEYVYYWKDMFEEAGVEVPDTWEEFKEVSKTLQEHFGASDPDFMAIALGAKDEWPDYPYMEFMPALVNGNGQNWNDMAKTDTPFAEGSDINIAYHRVYDLFTSGVLGKDPLGIGNDQATNLFAQKKSAIIALGDWGLQNIQNAADSTDELGTFYLPVRESESEPFRYLVQGDSFMGVTTHSKNPELAKAFVEWYYSDAWYPGYLSYISSASSMSNFPKDKDPILAESDALQPDGEPVMYDGGGDDFSAIQNEIAFDYKKLGAQMLTENFDLDAALAELDTKWTAARAKLGIE